MIWLMVALNVVGSPGTATFFNSLMLSIESSRTSGFVTVVASATNHSQGPVEFCGRWGYEVNFIPSPECEENLAVFKEHQEKEKSAAEKKGETHYGKCGPHLDPRVYDIRGFVAGENLIKMRPGESYTDSVSFHVPFDWYKDWPGSIEVKYRLDLCEEQVSGQARIPGNGRGGALVAVIHVP